MISHRAAMPLTADLEGRERGGLLDCKAGNSYRAAGLREKAKQDKMVPGTTGLEKGYNRSMCDVGKLLKDAWGDVTQLSIARCWALADALPPEHQQVIQDLRRKKGQERSVDKNGIDGASAEEAAKQLKQCLGRLSFGLLFAPEEICAKFKDLGDMLNSLGIEQGKHASDDVVRAAFDWFNLESQEGVSEAVELDRKDDVPGNIESNIGYCTDDEFGSNSEDVEGMLKSPQEISQLLDGLDEHAVSIRDSKGHDLLRQVRERFIPRSLEERIVQPDGTEIAETLV